MGKREGLPGLTVSLHPPLRDTEHLCLMPGAVYAISSLISVQGRDPCHLVILEETSLSPLGLAWHTVSPWISLYVTGIASLANSFNIGPVYTQCVRSVLDGDVAVNATRPASAPRDRH